MSDKKQSKDAFADALKAAAGWTDASAPERVQLDKDGDGVVGRFCGLFRTDTQEGERWLARMRGAVVKTGDEVRTHDVVDVWASSRLIRNALEVMPLGYPTSIVRTPGRKTMGSKKKGEAVVYDVRQDTSVEQNLEGCIKQVNA